MAAHVNSRESEFTLDVHPSKDAVARAIRQSNNARRPVVMADAQDNPGGGGHGDTTGLLAELIAQGARGVAFGLINDAESAAACHQAGVEATLKLSLGGKSFGAPLPVTAKVLRLTDGRYVSTGPMMRGNPCDLGPTALIEVAPGIRVIVVSKKTQALDQALFTHIGITPSEEKIVVLKSSVHFRNDFQEMAEEVIVAVAPGPVAVDSRVFPFKHLRPGLRLVPDGA
jgi:microcystin degradation protein MlrC